MTGWTAALDQLEQRLDAALVLADDRTSDPQAVAPFTVPAVSGTPTAEEAARALDLLRRGELALGQLGRVHEALGEELAKPAPAPRRSQAATMIDTRA